MKEHLDIVKLVFKKTGSKAKIKLQDDWISIDDWIFISTDVRLIKHETIFGTKSIKENRFIVEIVCPAKGKHYMEPDGIDVVEVGNFQSINSAIRECLTIDFENQLDKLLESFEMSKLVTEADVNHITKQK